jgi:hypothetical protein
VGAGKGGWHRDSAPIGMGNPTGPPARQPWGGYANGANGGGPIGAPSVPATRPKGTPPAAPNGGYVVRPSNAWDHHGVTSWDSSQNSHRNSWQEWRG